MGFFIHECMCKGCHVWSIVTYSFVPYYSDIIKIGYSILKQIKSIQFTLTIHAYLIWCTRLLHISVILCLNTLTHKCMLVNRRWLLLKKPHRLALEWEIYKLAKFWLKGSRYLMEMNLTHRVIENTRRFWGCKHFIAVLEIDSFIAWWWPLFSEISETWIDNPDQCPRPTIHHGDDCLIPLQMSLHPYWLMSNSFR